MSEKKKKNILIKNTHDHSKLVKKIKSKRNFVTI